MLFNLLECFRRLQVAPVLVVALDADTERQCERRYGRYGQCATDHWFIHTVCMEQGAGFSASSASTSTAEQQIALFDAAPEAFGTVGFKAICNEKAWLVCQVLLAGIDILWTDTDIVWLRDAREDLYAIERASFSTRSSSAEASSSEWWTTIHHCEAPESFKDGTTRIINGTALSTPFDLIIQSDDDGVCAGFYLMRATNASKSYMRAVLDYLNPVIDDQIAMRRHLQSNEFGMRTILLDRVRFPNGSVYFQQRLPQRMHVEPSIVHNNCIVGHDSKRRRFEQFSLWSMRDEWLTAEEANTMTQTMTSSTSVAQPLFSFVAHSETVTALTFRDGQTLDTCSYDKLWRTWTLREEQATMRAMRYVHRRGGPWSIQWCAQRNLMFTGGHDRVVCAWRESNGHDANVECQYTFGGHALPINDLDVSASTLASASDDQSIHVYDIETQKRSYAFLGHIGSVSSVRFGGGGGGGGSGSVLFSCGVDGTARAWQASTARCMALYTPTSDTDRCWMRCIEVCDRLLFTGDVSGTVRCWAQRTSECIWQRSFGVNSGVSALKLYSADADTKCLLVATEDGHVHALTIADGQRTKSYDSGASLPLTSLDCTNRHIAAGSSNGTVFIWPLL